MTSTMNLVLSKDPEIVLCFWIIKILATTLGETDGDTVTMSMLLGYATSTLIFAALFVAAIVGQMRTARLNPCLYWLTIVATTTFGTTMANFADRSPGIGYAGDGAVVFGTAIILIAEAYDFSRISHVALFWAAFILTRPLGATAGDLLDKTTVQGGFELSRIGAFVVLIGAMLLLIVTLPPRAGLHPAQQRIS